MNLCLIKTAVLIITMSKFKLLIQQYMKELKKKENNLIELTGQIFRINQQFQNNCKYYL